MVPHSQIIEISHHAVKKEKQWQDIVRPSIGTHCLNIKYQMALVGSSALIPGSCIYQE